MQPYFLPYFEHFRLINACDQWVVFDTAQYSRKSWISRNRIVNKDKGTSYISVPVKHVGEVLKINEAQIDNATDWGRRLFNMLRVYEAEAPFYRDVLNFLAPVFSRGHGLVFELNVDLLKAVCSYLEIETPIVYCSELDVEFPENCGAGEWALHIAQHLSATEYRNPSGGRALFDPLQFKQFGLRLVFHEHKPRRYAVGRFDFVQDLSVVDFLMWNDPETLKSWLQ